MSRGTALLTVVVAVGVAAGVLAFGAFGTGSRDSAEAVATATSTDAVFATTSTTPASTTTSAPPTTTTTEPVREPGTVPGWTVGRSWGSVTGLTMFRGNPTRTFYGMGPVPKSPSVAWSYPDSAMCSTSSAGGETKVWCGMGWTGQPVVYERSDGVTELIFGAYDRAVHFVDANTGTPTRPRYVTGDLIKGSVTLDPDGFPLLYFGSRDNQLRILALDRDSPEVLWSLNANEVNGIWNNDWDSNPSIIDDVMYEGGENGWFFAYLLNRSVNTDGLVTVEPERLVAMPGYNDDLISKSGRNVSIETSVVAFEDRVYFGNSGGRVVGLDVSRVREREAPIVFDYYAGGDIDATIVVDADGYLYVSIEHEPSQMDVFERERNHEVGQLVKLDPYADGDPRIWGLDLTDGFEDAGLWATPALHEGVLYVNTHNGDLLAVDSDDGSVVWSDEVGWHSWSSPAVVDQTLIVATCLGDLRGYSLADPRSPALEWTVPGNGACLEATPAVWDGSIYLGSRDGFMRAYR
ncbi:MAG: PQQ-binding-like beta-propeller repeat protein [Actinomycetota bacterium]|nr:PQQ-binding-like beta-propeller repeat protein [Actinomycetota bacterium]